MLMLKIIENCIKTKQTKADIDTIIINRATEVAKFGTHAAVVGHDVDYFKLLTALVPLIKDITL